MTSSITSQGGLKVSLYIHVYDRLAPGANCRGNVLSINANIIIVFLGYTCQKTISMNNTFRDCKSKVNITGLLGDLGTNKQHCKLSQCHVATLKILRFLLKTHCRRRGWWYHVPHSSWNSHRTKCPSLHCSNSHWHVHQTKSSYHVGRLLFKRNFSK